MKESKTITFGDILDLMDASRESDERIILHVGFDFTNGRVCSPLWKPFERLAVESIGVGYGSSLEVWTHDPK